MLRAVTPDPLLVTAAFQALLTLWLLPKVQVTVQPRIAASRAVILTSAWKPPCHCPTTVYVAAQPALSTGGVVVGVVGGVDTLGEVDAPAKIAASLAVALMPSGPLTMIWPQVV